MKVEDFIKKYNVSFQKINIREYGPYEIAYIFFGNNSYVLSFSDYVYGWGYSIDSAAKFTLVDFVKHQLQHSDTKAFIVKFGQECYNDLKTLEWKSLEDFLPDINISKTTALVKHV